MTPALLLSALSVALAYVIGSIPFGFLVARWGRGIDIRTVGSGNVGATNVGRILGFRYFVLVMLLDLFKGLGPTLGFPIAVEAMTGQAVPVLAVPVALAAILGHNFSVFLRFKGGKGVATSLGAVIALDPVAALAAAVAFLAVLLITRYVSMSSILGGTVFVIVHFATIERPISGEAIPLAILVLLLYFMLIYRHRSNLARIRTGTESKVHFGKPRRDGRSLVIALAALGALGGVIAGGSVLLDADRRAPTLRVGSAVLAEVDRFRTGHQRAGDLTFADHGRILVVSCPRYNRLVFFRIDDDGAATEFEDLKLHGRPVAVRSLGDRLFVLQRPTGDDRHLEAGFWETFALDGTPLGSKFRLGWDPDDLAFSPDGRHAYVLVSGHAEGEKGKHDPALIVVSIGVELDDHTIISRTEFLDPGDDPARIVLSESGRFAAVVLDGSLEVAGFDLANPLHPEPTGRIPLVIRSVPYLSPTNQGDVILMPVDSDRETVLVSRAPGFQGPLLVSTVPYGSALQIVHGIERRAIGRLPLRGPLNFGTIIPTGLAYCPDRALLAVADRSGGVRLVSIREPAGPGASTSLASSQQDR